MVRRATWLALLVIVHIVSALINNTAIEEKNLLETRRYNNKNRETSSSEGARSRDSDGTSNSDSIGMTSSSDSSSDSNQLKKHVPQSSEERRGWRKWHRKCTPCPEDMKKKWRDPTIKWICGGYQRARRTFKSLCMMHYRNCQDGTMFVKIKDHRCDNSSALKPHGDHFFYEYRVVMSDDSDSASVSVSSEFSFDSGL